MANFGTTRAVTGSYVCLANDQNIMCNATAGAANVTLPSLNAEIPRTINVFKTDATANAITILAPAGYSIVSAIGVSINVQDEAITITLGPGTVWYVGGEAESSVTLQGNTFNGASELVQLDGAGNLPALDAGALTNLHGGAFDAATVNGANQVVQNDGAGDLPALDGSALTNVAAATAVNATNSADSALINGFAIVQAAANSDVAALGVVTPAGGAYVQADQTANADAILELKTQLNALQAKLRTAVVLAP